MDDDVMLESCGSYPLAAERCTFWASVVCKFGLQEACGVEIRRTRATGWAVFLSRQDGEVVSETILTRL